jgi:uncharacterized protein
MDLTTNARARIGRLIDLYERNYRLIEQLVPELNLPFVSALSRSQSDLPLHLVVQDRSPYTCSFRLTYEIDGRCEPDMWLKVYRDARLAESLFCAKRPQWLAQTEGDPAAASYVDDQWGRNHMLHKWLQYLLHHGHGFGLASRPRMREVGAKGSEA